MNKNLLRNLSRNLQAGIEDCDDGNLSQNDIGLVIMRALADLCEALAEDDVPVERPQPVTWR